MADENDKSRLLNDELRSKCSPTGRYRLSDSIFLTPKLGNVIQKVLHMAIRPDPASEIVMVSNSRVGAPQQQSCIQQVLR